MICIPNKEVPFCLLMPISGASAGFGSLSAYNRSSSADAYIGFRLCQETEEKAKYFGQQFIELWAEYLKFNFTVGNRLK